MNEETKKTHNLKFLINFTECLKTTTINIGNTKMVNKINK